MVGQRAGEQIATAIAEFWAELLEIGSQQRDARRRQLELDRLVVLHVFRRDDDEQTIAAPIEMTIEMQISEVIEPERHHDQDLDGQRRLREQRRLDGGAVAHPVGLVHRVDREHQQPFLVALVLEQTKRRPVLDREAGLARRDPLLEALQLAQIHLGQFDTVPADVEQAVGDAGGLGTWLFAAALPEEGEDLLDTGGLHKVGEGGDLLLFMTKSHQHREGLANLEAARLHRTGLQRPKRCVVVEPAVDAERGEPSLRVLEECFRHFIPGQAVGVACGRELDPAAGPVWYGLDRSVPLLYRLPRLNPGIGAKRSIAKPGLEVVERRGVDLIRLDAEQGAELDQA